MKNSKAIDNILKSIRFPRAEMTFEFVSKRRGLGYVENSIVSEKEAMRNLFAKKLKNKSTPKPETLENTKIAVVRRKKGQTL